MNSESNAMTEVALALAMAFFAIFILAAVSMGMPVLEKSEAAQLPEIAFAKVGGDSRELREDELLVIYYQGSFYDADLSPFETLEIPITAQCLLAVAASLSLSELLTAKSDLACENSTVTILSDEWLVYLESRIP